MTDTDEARYFLREANAEIARHHELIAEMRTALEWCLAMLNEQDLHPDDRAQIDRYLHLLYRQVG